MGSGVCGPPGGIIFGTPWGERADLWLGGTTDADHTAGPEDVRISREEIAYLLGILQRLYPRSGELKPISAFSSLRPLVQDHTVSPTTASRGHRIWNSADGVLHISGGKYTTYRAMSEEAVDELAREIAHIHETASAPLGGNSLEKIARLRASAPQSAAGDGLAANE